MARGRPGPQAVCRLQWALLRPPDLRAPERGCPGFGSGTVIVLRVQVLAAVKRDPTHMFKESLEDPPQEWGFQRPA